MFDPRPEGGATFIKNPQAGICQGTFEYRLPGSFMVDVGILNNMTHYSQIIAEYFGHDDTQRHSRLIRDFT